MPTPRRLKPTPAEQGLFAACVAGAKAAGFRVPRVALALWDEITNADGNPCYAAYDPTTKTLHVCRKDFNEHWLAHELAHVIALQCHVLKAEPHNRVWGSIHSALYTQLVG